MTRNWPSDRLGAEMTNKPFAVELHGGIEVGDVPILWGDSPMKDSKVVSAINVAFEKAVQERLDEIRAKMADQIEDGWESRLGSAAFAIGRAIRTFSLDSGGSLTK